MKEAALISVIVPVYNVEPYLDQCIASIVHQTYSNLEIILVDDGSPDNCGHICDAWAQKDGRISVYHKSNGGLMSAWKYGVQRSTGDYIGFVDSDDWIEPEMYERLYEAATARNADLVCCGWLQTLDDGTILRKEPIYLAEGTYHSDAIRQTLFPVLFSGNGYTGRGLSPNRVTKLFKRDVIEAAMEHCSDHISIGEDLVTTFSALLQTRSITVLASFFPYHYRLNPSSMIKKYSDRKYHKICQLRTELLKINQLHAYDFSCQINTDFLKLILMQLEDEILNSGKSWAALQKSIRLLHTSSDVQQALQAAEPERLPKKYKLYLYFMEKHLYSAAILMRKFKQAKK